MGYLTLIIFIKEKQKEFKINAFNVLFAIIKIMQNLNKI